MNRRSPHPQYVQFCARCHSKWPVVSAPADWCPRCGGVLLAPSAKDTPPENRNFHWVARRPGSRTRAGGLVPRPRTSTPRYSSTPDWSLPDPPPDSAPQVMSRVDGLAERAPGLLVATAILFIVAALAEIARYALLIYNRTRLVDSLVVQISDIAVWTASVAAALVGAWTAVACAAWLVAARRKHFARQKLADPRSPRRVFAGCLVPGVNLVMPGVMLTELTAQSVPRVRRLARVWWVSWAASVALVIAALLWRRAESLQLMADGVLVYAWTDFVAAGMALLTLTLIRSIEGRRISGRVQTVRRWVPATGPAREVIEPIRPVTSTAKESPAP